MAIRERDLELDRKYAPPKAKDAGKLNDEGCDHLENGRRAFGRREAFFELNW